MASEHISKKTHRQSEWPDCKVSEELKRSEDDVHNLGDSRHEHHVLQILEETMLLDCHSMEGDIYKYRQRDRKSNVRHCRELDYWDYSKEVIGQNEGKNREEEWDEFLEIFANHILADVISDKAVDHLTSKLESAGNYRGFT